MSRSYPLNHSSIVPHVWMDEHWQGKGCWGGEVGKHHRSRSLIFFIGQQYLTIVEHPSIARLARRMGYPFLGKYWCLTRKIGKLTFIPRKLVAFDGKRLSPLPREMRRNKIKKNVSHGKDMLFWFAHLFLFLSPTDSPSPTPSFFSHSHSHSHSHYIHIHIHIFLKQVWRKNQQT